MGRINLLLVLSVVFIFAACSYERSSTTGWEFNNSANGGFEKKPYEEQETGPGLILIEGGSFTMGRTEQDVMYENHNTPRTATVSSFYLDETEITNHQYGEYLYWTGRTFTDFPSIYKKALPDTLVWRSKLAYNEPYVEYYLRHPSYRDYPVVGVNWLQANNFCAWRTDRVNEYILIREGILVMNPDQQNNPFTTDAYFAGQYEEGLNEAGQMPNLDPSAASGDRARDMGTRNVRMEDGILLPRYRLPTEAEWEFAAYGLIGNTVDGRITERRIYPWNGHWVRNPDDKWQGDMMANFVRGRGDYMGISGNLNDNADVTAPVISYWPNDYGLYNMAGNVSEWVMDVYRASSSEDYDEFRPFRGNVFKTKVLNVEGAISDKYEEPVYDLDGIKQYLIDFKDERQGDIDRVHGYGAREDKVDELEMALFNAIDVQVAEAFRLRKDKQHAQAAERIKEIEDVYLTINDSIQGLDGYDEYELEIIPMLREGLSEFILNTPGNVKMREVTTEENIKRRNYRVADNIDELDGDLRSSLYYPNGDMGGPMIEAINANPEQKNTGKKEDWVMYQSGKDQTLAGARNPTTLVSDKSRVFKGASWRDRAYWMNPGTRRFLDEDLSTSTIGFRCAMDRVGSPVGLGSKRK